MALDSVSAEEMRLNISPKSQDLRPDVEILNQEE